MVLMFSPSPDALSKEIGYVCIYLMLISGCMEILPMGLVQSAVSSLMDTVSFQYLRWGNTAILL